MNPFTAVTTLIVSLLWIQQASGQSFEMQAVADTRRCVAADLDVHLPQQSFGEWFEKLVGTGNRVVWQLSECGDSESASKSDGPRACVEANTILKDGRKVILMIAVGTFKTGVTHSPTFQYGVVEQGSELRPIHRLSDLPALLSSQNNSAINSAKPPRLVSLPALTTMSVIVPPLTSLNIPLEYNHFKLQIDLTDVPPPPPAAKNSSPNPSEAQSIRTVPDEVLEGNALKRMQPIYPPTARLVHATGMVKVRITISETGKVIDAKAISGYNALRPAAEEAAKNWLFRPTTVDGAPIKVQGTLTFNFKTP